MQPSLKSLSHVGAEVMCQNHGRYKEHRIGTGMSSVHHVNDNCARTPNSSKHLMCSHPRVEFHALHTNYAQYHGFTTLAHVQAFIPLDLITVCSCSRTNNSSNNNSPLWSDSDLQPTTRLRFTEDQQHGQIKTQHSVHNTKGMQNWSCCR